MDLITFGGDGALNKNEENILRADYNSIDKDLNFKDKDWIHQSIKSFERLHEFKNIWAHLSKDRKIKESHYFYDCIFRCAKSSKSKTEWINTELFDDNGDCKDFTADHPFTARIVMRIIMTDWSPFMNNLDEYTEIIDYITQTVGISKKENQDVKVHADNNGDIKVDKLTKEKYSRFKFKNRNTGEIKEGLPFEIPLWFEEGEIKRLYSDKEILAKQLKNMNKPGLIDKAILCNIDLKKSVNGRLRAKTKDDLIKDIIEYHNDQVLP
jgi:hypothetical protein